MKQKQRGKWVSKDSPLGFNRVFYLMLCFTSFASIQANFANANLYGGIEYKFELTQNEIKGSVMDSNGSPLPGVSVLVVGTQRGVQTNFDGEYTIIANKGDVLEYSYIGMKTVRRTVVDGNTLNIEMEEDAAALDEVVVIGYGATVAKKDLTGAVSSANLEQALDFPNVSIVKALQGTIAGLDIGTSTSAGQNPTINIRGQNTLSSASGDNSPLIVLDGIIYRGSLVDLNTSDIASIDILKDASSAAIYGSQASNGVIVITSKTGRIIGKPVINYSTSYSAQTPSNVTKPMRAKEYEQHYPDIFWAEGGRLAPDYLKVNPAYVWQNNLKTNEIYQGYVDGLDTPWWDLFTGDGKVATHNISIRGKTDFTNYFVSGGFTDQEGYLKNDNYKKYNFRINFDADITNWLKVGTQSYAVISDYSGQDAGSSTPYYAQPWTPIYKSDGEILKQPDGSWINPYLTIARDNADVRKNFSINLFADIKLPLDGLKYHINYANNFRTRNFSSFNPEANNFTGHGEKSYNENWDWTVDNILSYQKSFNNEHNLNVTLLYGVEKVMLNGFNSGANNFAIDLLGFDRLQAGDPTLNTVSSSKEQETSLYTMARILYNYKNKYYFTGTVRRDGFSGFGENNKTAIFPTGALGWVLSRESFLEDSSWLDFLKLRASYGQSGRRGLGRYDTSAVVSSGPNVVFGDGGQTFLGQYISSLASPDLGWETTTGSNFGLDYAFLDSRINGSIEYYRNKTENILFGIALPTITGFNSINSNIAEVSNQGLEINLSSTIVKTKDWRWDINFNYSRVRNKIESILGPENDNDGDGKEDDLIGNGLFIGEPRDVIYGYEITGMWQLEDEANNSIWQGFYPGTYKLKDLNDDGKISSLDDRKILGYSDPAYRFGIGNTVNYKNLALYVFINSIQGGENYYMGNDAPEAQGNLNKRDQLSYSNWPTGAWDYWMPENPGAKYRRLDRGSQYGGVPLTQRNFVRLQNVSLSYVFSKPIQDALGVANLKLFLSGENLATWTKWKGIDPETGSGFGNGVPLLKSYTMGLNVEF